MVVAADHFPKFDGERGGNRNAAWRFVIFVCRGDVARRLLNPGDHVLRVIGPDLADGLVQVNRLRAQGGI